MLLASTAATRRAAGHWSGVASAGRAGTDALPGRASDPETERVRSSKA